MRYHRKPANGRGLRECHDALIRLHQVNKEINVTKFRLWVALGMASVIASVAGCGGSGSSTSGSPSLRVINATLTHPSIDLLVNSTVSISGTAKDAISAYVTPAAGSTAVQVNDAGSSTALVTVLPNLVAGNHYSLLVYESGGAVQTVLLTEDYATPTASTAQLRVYDAANDAGRLDVYITAPSVDLATLSSPTSTLTAGSATDALTYSPGTYRIRVTGRGNVADLRLDIPAVTLANQQFATVVLTPASGGVLLDGAALIQQGTYSATRNTNARVRLVAAVSGNATVAANSTSSGASSVTIDAGSIAPSFGYYVLVPTTNTLNVTVNGASVGAPAGTLKAGSDSTLIVYGSPTNATATLIADDNRLPSDTTAVKLRLINGVTGNVGALTLTANSNLVGAGVAPGAASGYVSVTGSTTAMNLSLTSSLSPGIFYSDATNILSVRSVYTILAAGDAAKPQFLIR